MQRTKVGPFGVLEGSTCSLDGFTDVRGVSRVHAGYLLVVTGGAIVSSMYHRLDIDPHSHRTRRAERLSRLGFDEFVIDEETWDIRKLQLGQTSSVSRQALTQRLSPLEAIGGSEFGEEGQFLL